MPRSSARETSEKPQRRSRPAGKDNTTGRAQSTPAADVQGDGTELSLTDRAYRQIEELIVTLQLPPGTALSEAALVQRLDIGRTPIREALQRLTRDGLVAILPRRGVLVTEINLRTQLRLLEVRRELERLMGRLAAQRVDEDERKLFEQLASEMRAAARDADDLAFMRLDREFNNALAIACRNEFASRSIGLMSGLSRRFWYQHYKEVADLPRAAALHAEVAEAIARKDVDAAGAASDKLMNYIESFTRQTLTS